MLTAQELFDRAVDLGNAGRHAAAARALATAAGRTSDPDLAARIAGTRAYLRAETGDPASAIAACRAALADPGLSDHTRAVLVSQIGLVELRSGRLDDALRHLTAATPHLAADPARLGRVLLNRGLAHLDRGQVDAAEQDFAAAADALERSGEVVERAKARHNAGYAALVRGDLVHALQAMEDARTVLVTLSPVAVAVCDLDRAAVLRAAGETTEAVRLLTGVARVLGARRLRQAQAEAELALTDALLPADPAAAVVVARRASRRFAARGNALGALRADARALTAAVLATSGPATGSRTEVLRDGLAATADALAARGLGAEAWPVRLQRARLDVRTGRLAEAHAVLRRARPVPASPVADRVLAREVRAELAAAEGRRALVLAQATAGLDELERWQGAFGSADLQSSAAVLGRPLVLQGVRAALALGDPVRAFAWSERARSLAGRVVPLRPHDDPATAAELAELRLLRLAGGAPSSAEGRREAELRASVRRRAWAQEGAAAPAPAAALDEVREALAADDADLVAYLWSGDRVAAVVVGDDVRLVDLGAWAPVGDLLGGLLADLDMVAADLPAALAAVVEASLRARLDRLDALLVAPVRVSSRRARVVLTPTGNLAGVPWGMLDSFAGVALARPPSAARWLDLRRSTPRLDRAGFAAGPGVARGPDEVRAAAASWAPRDVVLDGAATVAGVASLARSVDVLHLAAHGRHSADNPLFSGVELVDGTWFGYDVERLPRVPPVVVLSACELGRSASGWGREALGMSHAWLHAGARTVLAASASVNDGVAHDLLGAVHGELAAGAAPAEALVAATGRVGVRTPFAVNGAGW